MTFPINCILFPEYKWSENPKREKKINLKAKELKKNYLEVPATLTSLQ